MAFPYNFVPTNISGCFAWFDAGTITVPNASSVFTWNDSSGSGNHLLNGTGIFIQTATPAGNPAVTFTNVHYLFGSGNPNPSVINNPANITAFYVFRTNAPTGTQVLSAYENVFVGGRDYYGSSLTGTSGWTYNYSNNGGPATISSTIVPFSSGEWIIRTDKCLSNFVDFCKNSTIRDSGAFLTGAASPSKPNQISTETLTIGASQRLNQFMDGDIAEVILYGRSLEEGERGFVETYLKYKHFINGNSAPLFIWGAQSPTGLIYNPSTTLYTYSATPSGTMTLYVGNSVVANSSMTLYIGNSSSPTSGIPLFIWGSTTASGSSMNLFTTNFGPPKASGSIPLYIFYGTQQTDLTGYGLNSRPMNTQMFNGGLFYGGYQFSSLGASGTIAQLNLFVQADSKGTTNASMPLYLQGPPPATGFGAGFTLFLQNSNTLVQSGIKLYVGGLGTLNGGLIANNNMNLYLQGKPGTFNNIPLFVMSQLVPSSIPLFVQGGQSGVNSNMTLFVNGTPPISSGNIPLFLQSNFSINSSVNLCMSGLGLSNSSTNIYTHGF